MIYTNVNMRALKAVSMFASGEDQPMKHGVQMLDDDLYVALTNHMLGMVSVSGGDPATVVSRVIDQMREFYAMHGSRGDASVKFPRISTDLIQRALKPGGASIKGEWDMKLEGDVITFEHYNVVSKIRTSTNPSTVTDYAIDKPFANITSVLSTDEPQALPRDVNGGVGVYGLSPLLLTTMCDAGVVLAGGPKVAEPFSFHGGDHNLLPSYWSTRTDNGTLVVVLMSVRISGSGWGANKLKAVAS